MVKSKSAGRFGVRYGLLVRKRIANIEDKQRCRQRCIYCGGKAKRLSKGIWLCRKCGKKFAGHAYYLLQSQQEEVRQTEKSEEQSKANKEKQKPKALKK